MRDATASGQGAVRANREGALARGVDPLEDDLAHELVADARVRWTLFRLTDTPLQNK